MNRWRTLTIATGIALLAGLATWYFIDFSTNQKSTNAIPRDAIAVYKGTDPIGAYQKLAASSTGKIFQLAKSFQSFDNTLNHLDTFRSQASNFFQAAKDKPFYLSLHKTSHSQLGLLVTFQTNHSDPLYHLNKKLQETYPLLSLKKRTLYRSQVWDYFYKDKLLFTLSESNGILLASQHSILVEDGLRQLKKGKPIKFHKSINKSREPDLLYVNYQHLPTFLSTFTKPQIHDILKKTTFLPGFAHYNLNIRDDALQLTGSFHPADSQALINTFRKQPSARHFESVVPKGVAFLHAFSLPDVQAVTSPPFQQSPLTKPSNESIDSLEAWYGFDINQDFRPLLGHQVCLGINEPIGSEFSKQTFAVIHYRDTTNAFKNLKAFASQKRQHPLTTATFKRMTYRGFDMRQLAVGNAFELALGPIFSTIENPYYTTIEDCAVMATNPVTLKRIIDDYKAGQTLRHAPHYENLKAKLLPKSLQFTYINPGYGRQLPLSFLTKKSKRTYKKGFHYYAQFSGLAFQLTRDSLDFFSQVTLLERTTTGTFTQKVWEQSLDAPVASSPQKVINPKTGQPQLLLGDEQQQLYLIKNDGSIKWKKTLLTEKMGPVDTIDLYQNGNQQYLFATRGKLHLLNASGKEVGGFPLSLSAPAASEVQALAYNGQNQPRYFVGCQNNNVYGYQPNGRPLRGWSPVNMEAPLEFKLSYFSYGDKLRLFGVSKNGTLHLWNQNGQLKKQWDFNTRFTQPFSMQFGATDSTTYLVSTDTTGTAHFLYLNQDTVSRKFATFGPEHHFLLADLNKDGAKSLIFAEGRKIRGYLPDGTREFTLTLQDSLAFKPKIYQLGGQSYIGYVSAETHRIFLIDQQGRPYRGFPIKGSTPFLIADMNRDSAKELVVGGKQDNLIMYQIQ